MRTRPFRWLVVCLLAMIVASLGVLDFLIWNQRIEPEQRAFEDASGPFAKGGSITSTSRREPLSTKEEGQGLAPQRAEPSEQENEEKSDKEQPKRSAGPADKHKKPTSGGDGEASKSLQLDTEASRIYVKVGSATRLG